MRINEPRKKVFARDIGKSRAARIDRERERERDALCNLIRKACDSILDAAC